jgi:hypothetical protein
VNGSLYGTNQLLNSNGGTVFELYSAPGVGGSDTWNQSTIFTFTGGPEGRYPTSVEAGPNGTIYGTTDSGGNLSCTGSCGVVFQLTPTSQPGGPASETLIYSFLGGQDGVSPQKFVVGKANTLYGVSGGASNPRHASAITAGWSIG